MPFALAAVLCSGRRGSPLHLRCDLRPGVAFGFVVCLQHRKRDISSFAEPNPFFVVNVYPNEQAGIVFAILANMAPGSLERVNSNLAMEEDMFKGSVILMIVAPCLALTGCQSANMYSGTATPGCVAGTVGGAVVGGLAGATIGSGTGQLWAVGGGATLGGAAGSALTCR